MVKVVLYDLDSHRAEGIIEGESKEIIEKAIAETKRGDKDYNSDTLEEVLKNYDCSIEWFPDDYVCW
jgi:hypothetical protein